MGVKLPAGAFFGRRVRGQRVAGLVLTEYAYAPGERIPAHTHENAYFSLVLAGAYAETYGGRGRDCRASAVVVHPAGEVHSEHVGPAGARTFSVEAAPRDGGPALARPGDFRGGPPAWLAHRLYREFRRPDAFSPLAVEGLFLEIGAALARQPDPAAGPRPGWLGRVRDLLRRRFAERLSLAEVAREAGVHPVHLARTFRAACGCTVGEYVRRLRVDYARARLAGSDAPVAEVALAAGFADQSHFSRVFRALTGVSPAAYRGRRAR
jgi:AraC family transcriptional regulator